MEISQEPGPSLIDNRSQLVLQSLSKCKKEFLNEKEECQKVKELNTKLEAELKETRELEKSHRYHLITSREMIGNLQETVSHLVFLKRDVKKLKDEIASKDTTISALQKEKNMIIQGNEENIMEIRNDHEKYAEDLKSEYEKKFQQKQIECDTKIAQFMCANEELRSQIKNMEAESRDKMNVVVLEYEEKIQRGAAHIAQLQEQLVHQAARTDANIDAYKRRLEELEEKLKQNQFKLYLNTQNVYSTPYDNKGERPYSVNRDPYTATCSVDQDPVLEVPKPHLPTIYTQAKTQKTNIRQNKLPVMVSNVEKPPDKKGGMFNITKKRKLFNEKDFQEF